MIYSAYLNLLSQINDKKRAKLCIDNEIIDITQAGDVFLLCGIIGEGISPEFKKNLKVDSPDSKLIYSENGLSFVQEVRHLDRFIQFKILILNYLDLLRFWRGVLETEPLHH